MRISSRTDEEIVLAAWTETLDRLARVGRRLVLFLSTEWGYLRSDASQALAAATPARRSVAVVALGALVVIYGIAQWLPVLAIVLTGIALVVYGLLFVDVDARPSMRRRR